MNSKYLKSAVRTYNAAAQTVTDALTQLVLLGSSCTDTGCSLSPLSNGVEVESSGLYYVSADVTFTPTAAGALIVQLYNGATPLPCAVSTDSAEAGNIASQHVETVLCLSSCCACKPLLNVRTSGVAGDVNFVGMSVVRLA